MAQVYKGAGTKVAKMCGESSVMDQSAEKIRVKALANAAKHKKTGEYSQSFSTKSATGKKGVRDRIVQGDHPASAVIEYGHFAEKADGTLGKFVPGQFNLTRAIR
ncbi:DUF5403 family protein [Corynebacterium sp. AOP12-C2-36]|uniref:DUF5403 family protein n=1 Tax=Corynebacterium sp. AOP12-C2-36 TaxID=3457723 RepID=UPI0040337378